MKMCKVLNAQHVVTERMLIAYSYLNHYDVISKRKGLLLKSQDNQWIWLPSTHFYFFPFFCLKFLKKENRNYNISFFPFHTPNPPTYSSMLYFKFMGFLILILLHAYMYIYISKNNMINQKHQSMSPVGLFTGLTIFL